MSETYLQLAPEQGGHRFGPFRGGAVYFGTDRGRCQIMLDTSTGLSPCHAILAIAPNGTYTFSVTDRANEAYVIQAGSNQAHRVSGAFNMNPGDTLCLGSTQGPRFTIQRAGGVSAPYSGRAANVPPGHNAPPGYNAPPGQMGRRPGQPGYGQALGQEVHRQVEASLLTKVPIFRVAQEWLYRYKTGSLSNPRNLISLVVVVLGMLITGCVGCAGAIGALISQLGP